jgi:hypothetical protein
MKKYLLLLFAAVVCLNTVTAQATRVLKKVMELKMPKTAEDDMPGTRGASVVWHPVQKKYYAVMAGNALYPLAVYNAIGKRISDDTLTALIDSRGLWYNTVTKQICGNGYNDNGWYNYTLNKMGIPTELIVKFAGLNQPNEQAVGAFNTLKKEVFFLNGSQIVKYSAADASTKEEDKVLIHWGLTKADGIAADEDVETVPEGYNYTTIVYTGIAGAEAGVLNIVENQIELYDYKTGFLSKKLTLPEGAITETAFNFAFANGIYWLFDIANRVWIGYK